MQAIQEQDNSRLTPVINVTVTLPLLPQALFDAMLCLYKSAILQLSLTKER